MCSFINSTSSGSCSNNFCKFKAVLAKNRILSTCNKGNIV